MEGSGGTYHTIEARNAAGEVVKTGVITSGDSIEIGGWSYNREDLLFAIGANASYHKAHEEAQEAKAQSTSGDH
jgi:hypothetical protein